MSNKFLIIIVSIVIGFFGIVLISKNKTSKQTSENNSAKTSNHVIGENQAGVVLVEYGDLECSACGAYFPTIEQIVEKYKSDIQFQFKHFPITSRHLHALEAARAAESAAKQDKFWEMYRILYQNQRTWSAQSNPFPTFTSYASQLKLDVEKFKLDYASSEVNDIINADIAASKQYNVSSTPTFILNGKKIDSAPSHADIEGWNKLIEDAIKKAKENKQ